MSHLGPAERPFQIMSLGTIGGFGGRSTFTGESCYQICLYFMLENSTGPRLHQINRKGLERKP